MAPLTLAVLSGCTRVLVESGYAALPTAGQHGAGLSVHAGAELSVDPIDPVLPVIGSAARVRTFGADASVFEYGPELGAELFVGTRPAPGGEGEAWEGWVMAYVLAHPWTGVAFGREARGFVFTPELEAGGALCDIRWMSGCVSVASTFGWHGGEATHPRGFTLGLSIGWGWMGWILAN